MNWYKKLINISLIRLFWFFRRIDDVTDATTIHLVCGVWGHLSVGFFADPPTGPKSLYIDGSLFRLKVQLISVLCIIAWSAVATFVLLLILDLIFKIRPSEDNELLGSDRVEHELDEDAELFRSPTDDVRYSDGMELRHRQNGLNFYPHHAATIDLSQRNGKTNSYYVTSSLNRPSRIQYNVNRAYEHE